MTIKAVKSCVGGAGADPTGMNAEAIIARLGAMRERSKRLLRDMEELEEKFRQHSERSGRTPQDGPKV